MCVVALLWLAGRRGKFRRRAGGQGLNVIGTFVLPEVGDPRWVDVSTHWALHFRLGKFRVASVVGVGTWQVFLGGELLPLDGVKVEVYGRSLAGRFDDERVRDLARRVDEEVGGGG